MPCLPNGFDSCRQAPRQGGTQPPNGGFGLHQLSHQRLDHRVIGQHIKAPDDSGDELLCVVHDVVDGFPCLAQCRHPSPQHLNALKRVDHVKALLSQLAHHRQFLGNGFELDQRLGESCHKPRCLPQCGDDNHRVIKGISQRLDVALLRDKCR